MIRINLLPVKAAKKREYGRQQLVLFVFLIILEAVILFMVLTTKKEQLAEIDRAVIEARTQIAQVQQLEARVASLSAQRNELVSIRRVLENLQANRIGPGGVMEELKYILNGWDSDRERVEQEARGWDTQIDPERVWLQSLTIEPVGFSLRGIARTGEDVAEFLLRLDSHQAGTDPFFVNPDLAPYSLTNDRYFGEVMQFSISGGVRYHPMALGIARNTEQ